VETLLLVWGGMSLFDGLCHSFGTLATGGYATKNASIGHYASGFIEWIIIVFMLIAGTNFSLHYRAIRGDWKVYFRNQEFLFFLSLVGIAVAVLSVDTFFNHYRGVEKTLRDTLFQTVAIVTTTGYGTADYEQWSFSSQFVLFMLMFFGGCAGSTGGGMKMMRVHLLVRFVFSEVTRLVHPRAVVPVRIGKNVIERDVVGNVVGFFILYMFIFAMGVFMMSTMGLDMRSSFGAVAATLNNIGPGLGSVGPTDNYAHIPSSGKWLLTVLMLMGRLEVYTVIILLSPSYWKK
jgi:trk system potassium uptake protein TrkH